MGYFSCRIKATQGNTCILRDLYAQGAVAFDHYHVADGYYTLELTEQEIVALRQCKVEVQHGKNLTALAQERKRERIVRTQEHDDGDDVLATGFVDHYMDAAEVATRIQALAAAFPALCSLTALPYNTTGYDGAHPGIGGSASVQLLRITTTPATASKPGLLLICGTHAREWVNPLIAIEFAEQLLRNYSPGSAESDIMAINRIVEEADIFIVPVMNPDGLNYSFHDNTGWRKNRSPNPSDAACPGVDNNRNYSLYFGEGGSSSAPCSDTYRGSSPFSEQENKNIRYILDQYPNIVIGVDSHSQGQKIFRPTASGGTFIGSLPVSPEDEAIYQELEAAAVAAIQGVSGTLYQTGTTSNHAGASDEYMFFGHRVFGFDFECALAHQPPLADGLVAVQEVTAALRALALKAIDFRTAAAAPISVVQCIDRTGSMVTFGYEASARANARRFVDLFSLGDETAIVSFADPSPDPAATPPANRATLDAPLAALTPGSYAGLHTIINGLVFGGWTSIGAGLAAAAAALAGATHPRSIVLLSDGFENRDPRVHTVLASFPANIRVYTIALGNLADTTLLQHIATQTGGRFYMSPSELELHEIYNYIRADVSDDDLVLNAVVDNSSDDNRISSHSINVEQGAQKLTVSLSWEGNSKKTDVVIIDPAGRKVCPSDWKARYTRGAGYLLVELRRPRAGTWTILPVQSPVRHTVAAFVRSPLRLRLAALCTQQRHSMPDTVLVRAAYGSIPLVSLTGTVQVDVHPPSLSKRQREQSTWTDAIPTSVQIQVASLKKNAASLRFHTSLLPIGYPAQMVSCQPPRTQQVQNPQWLHALSGTWNERENDTKGGLTTLHHFALPSTLATRFSSVRLHLQGILPDGSRIERVALITMAAQPRKSKRR